MSGQRPGDVVTVEPTEIGTVVVDAQGDRSELTSAWIRFGDLVDWDDVVRFGPITLSSVPAPAAAPAEDWEPVTADRVRVGDEIEVTRKWETGATATYRGTVRDLGADHQWAELAPTCNVNLLGAKAIRRRVRQPMAEPEAPCVVRHSGRVFARSAATEGSVQWLFLGGTPISHPSRWITWPEVVALDPATDPVVVDLGGAS